jgi:hypothetical protein
MADELDPQLDPEVETRLREALSRLRPDDDPAPTPPMPPAVWARMERAIAHESGLRTGTVVGLAPRRRMLKWAGPLVAVSAVVLGVVVMTNLPGQQPDVVADAETAMAAAEPKAVLQAGFVPPAMTVVDSAENFTPTSLRAGVTAVLEKLGVRSMGDMQRMATASAAPEVDETTLRECVTELTQSPTSQALIVIRATYDGAEAGVVVIPAVMMGDISTVDMSQISDPTLHIFVVGPQCGAQPTQVISHVLHAIGD